MVWLILYIIMGLITEVYVILLFHKNKIPHLLWEIPGTVCLWPIIIMAVLLGVLNRKE